MSVARAYTSHTRCTEADIGCCMQSHRCVVSFLIVWSQQNYVPPQRRRTKSTVIMWSLFNSSGGHVVRLQSSRYCSYFVCGGDLCLPLDLPLCTWSPNAKFKWHTASWIRCTIRIDCLHPPPSLMLDSEMGEVSSNQGAVMQGNLNVDISNIFSCTELPTKPAFAGMSSLSMWGYESAELSSAARRYIIRRTSSSGWN